MSECVAKIQAPSVAQRQVVTTTLVGGFQQEFLQILRDRNLADNVKIEIG